MTSPPIDIYFILGCVLAGIVFLFFMFPVWLVYMVRLVITAVHSAKQEVKKREGEANDGKESGRKGT